MSREKQIEEMDCKKCLHYEACQVAFRNSKSLSIYEEVYDEEQYFADTIDCDYYVDKNIYRKASDVAREIFADFQSILFSIMYFGNDGKYHLRKMSADKVTLIFEK